jgi:ribosomal protein S18 acetylase RimI-like enzyme
MFLFDGKLISNEQNDIMNTIEIRLTKTNEINELQIISKKTFVEAFSNQNTEKNMRRYLEENLSINQLTTELLNSESSFYFARMDEKIIGYLKINFGFAQTDFIEDDFIEIERVYVLEEFHGKEVGKKLLDKAIEISRENNAKSIWLGVWEKNYKAIRFYLKNGFVEFGQHNFILGDDIQTDILMKLQL